MTHYAWIGLANMGGPMAANLIKAGHQVSGVDLNESACAAAKNAGVRIVDSVADAVRDADATLCFMIGGEPGAVEWASALVEPMSGSVIAAAAANQNFTATFSAELAAKDVALALAAGEGPVSAPAAAGGTARSPAGAPGRSP